MSSNLKLTQIDYALFEQGYSYINAARIYFAYYSVLPNIKEISSINSTTLRRWIENELGLTILKKHYRQDYNFEKRKLEYIDLIYFLEGGLMVNIEDGTVYLVFASEYEQQAEALLLKFVRFRKKVKRKSEFSLIVSHGRSLGTTEIDIKKPSVDFTLHYNADFECRHKSVLKHLRKPNTNGLFLFHGQPGTGKSTYLKYLIHQINKKVIFLSPRLASNLDSVEMTSFLIENRNSIIVVEDAEELITSRNDVRNSAISMLLNLTDGILGDSLGIQIVATFNTKVRNIDQALMRKGRLTGIYEFLPLEIERTNALLKHLGHEVEVLSPLPLAEIYNFSTATETVTLKAIGF